MDAQYLKLNVHEALTEALSSMAVALPDDKVDYMGRYLLQYVERKKITESKAKSLDSILKEANREMKAEELREMEKDRIAEEKRKELGKLPQFLSSLPRTATSKESAMNLVCDFAAEFLKIPAAYVVFGKITPEGEILQYVSACKGQSHILGKTLKPPVEDGEEAPQRQGISFDAFKIPELDPSDEQIDEEGNPLPRPPPKAQPLLVENVMRDTRCKFYGIPKLGAYAAIPFSFDTLEHEMGCIPGTGEPDTPAYLPNKMTQKILFALDTIGSYRPFKQYDIEVAQKLGEALLEVFQAMEVQLFDKHVEFLTAHRAVLETVSVAMGNLATLEATALAAAAEEVAAAAAAAVPPPNTDGDEPSEASAGLPESFKPYKDSEAIVGVWSALFAPGEPVAGALREMENHVLPPPALVNYLFLAVAMISGLPLASVRDPYSKEPTWSHIRKEAVYCIGEKMASFKPAAVVTVAKDSSLLAIKELCERTNLLDPAGYPPHLPILGLMAQWLQRAVAAREAAMMYFLEAKGQKLENVV